MAAAEIAKLGVVDYIIFAAILIISAGIGIFHGCTGTKKKTTSEFLVAGRQMAVFPVTLSLFASFMSAITLLGTPAEIYVFGSIYCWIAIAYFGVMFAANIIYIPIFYRLKLTTSYEYLGLRFHKVIQVLGAIVFILQMIIYMGIVLYAPSLALNAVTGFNLWIAVFSVGIVCTFYTTIGGIKAVMWTDVFQTFMMFAGLFAILVRGSVIHGGFGNIMSIAMNKSRIQFYDFNLDPSIRHTTWSLTIGAFFTWLGIYGVNQTMVQRALTSRTLKGAQISYYLNIPGLTCLMGICCLCGFVVFANYSGCDPIVSGRISATDQLLPLFVMDTLSFLPGLPGLFTACLFSGALSTVSSGLNSLAAVTLHDLIMIRKPMLRDEVAAKITKVLAVGYGMFCLLFAYIASLMGQVLQAALGLFGMLSGPILGVFTLGMLFPFTNWKGALVGHLVSQFFILWVGFGYYIYGVKQPKLPVYTDQCPVYNATDYNLTDVMYSSTPLVSTLPTTSAPVLPLNAGIPKLYQMSYMWYSGVSFAITVALGLIVSAITGFNGEERTDPAYITPPLRKLWHRCPESSPAFIDKMVEDEDERGDNYVSVSGKEPEAVPMRKRSIFVEA